MKPSLRVIIVFPCFQIVYSSLPWWSWRNCCVFVFQGTLYLYRRLRMSKLVSSRSYRSYKPSNFQHQQQRRVFVVSQKLCLRLHWPGEEHYLFCLGEGRLQRRRHTSKCSLFLLSLSPNNLFIWGQNGCHEEEPSGSRVCSLRKLPFQNRGYRASFVVRSHHTNTIIVIAANEVPMKNIRLFQQVQLSI